MQSYSSIVLVLNFITLIDGIIAGLAALNIVTNAFNWASHPEEADSYKKKIKISGTATIILTCLGGLLFYFASFLSGITS
jgi:uncharacterized protein YqhQ